MTQITTADSVTLLDGGIGRQLMKMGAPFRQPEWSALALMEAPHFVRRAHEQFAAAGSDVLTTNSYAVVPYHIGEKRFTDRGATLAELSGRLAHEVATTYECRVAGSLPPLFGSYRPDLFSADKAQTILQVLAGALDPYVDIWLGETLSSIAEAEAVFIALQGDHRPVWISYTLRDEDTSLDDVPRLRSGEIVVKAVRRAAGLGAAAILFNCSRPEVMEAAVDSAIDELLLLDVDLPVGVYANSFQVQREGEPANLTIHEIRSDLGTSEYTTYATDWCRKGATILGGCCGIGPEHIRALHATFKGR